MQQQFYFPCCGILANEKIDEFAKAGENPVQLHPPQSIEKAKIPLKQSMKIN